MNAGIHYELARLVAADRQREAERARIARQARAVAAQRRGEQATTVPGAVVKRVRALLRARAA